MSEITDVAWDAFFAEVQAEVAAEQGPEWCARYGAVSWAAAMDQAGAGPEWPVDTDLT